MDTGVRDTVSLVRDPEICTAGLGLLSRCAGFTRAAVPTAAVFTALTPSVRLFPRRNAGVFPHSAAPGLYCAVHILDFLSK